jgi:hypothetical protein
MGKIIFFTVKAGFNAYLFDGLLGLNMGGNVYLEVECNIISLDAT